MLSELATKSELRAEMQLLRQEIANTRELLSKDLLALKNELTLRLGSMLAGGIVLLGVLQKLL